MFLSMPFSILPVEMIRCISSYLAVEDIQSVLCSCRMSDEYKLEWIPSVLQAYCGEDEDRLSMLFVRILECRMPPCDSNTVTCFVRAGVNINRQLLFAARGRDKIVKRLIDEGADVNVANHDGCTPLHFAVRGRDKHIVKRLIDEGADVNVADDDGYTPLHFATIKGHRSIVEMLIDAGADVNVADDDGCTPLHCAAIKGNRYIKKMLIDAEADGSMANHDGCTPLHYSRK